MSDDLSSTKLAKTQAGRAALTQRTLCSPRERQLMILCDGQRTLLDLAGLLGQEALPLVAGLERRGYLQQIRPVSSARLAELSATGTMAWVSSQEPEAVGCTHDAPLRVHAFDDRAEHHGSRRPARSPAFQRGSAPVSAKPPVPLSAASVSAQTVPAAPSRGVVTKRSLAGTKMYMLDVLRTQRSDRAQELVLQLQGVSDPHALLDQVGVVLAHLHAHCGASYTERVLSHLMDILPDSLLPAFVEQLEGMELLDLPLLTLQLG